VKKPVGDKSFAESERFEEIVGVDIAAKETCSFSELSNESPPASQRTVNNIKKVLIRSLRSRLSNPERFVNGSKCTNGFL